MVLKEARGCVAVSPREHTTFSVKLGFAVLAALSLLSLLYYIAVPQNALAATFFVRLDGSDTNCSGLANAADPGVGAIPRACATRTIQRAHDLAPFDSVINVGPGTYNGANDVTTLTKPMTIQPTNPALRPILQGNGVLGATAVFNIQTNNTTITGFEFQPFNVFHVYVGGTIYTDFGNYANINITNNIFNNVNNTAVAVSTSGSIGIIVSDVTITGNEFRGINNGSAGNGSAINVRTINRLNVSNNTFTGPLNFSGIIADSVASGTIANNVISGTGTTQSGIEVRSTTRSSSQITITDNSISGATTGSGILLSATGGNSISTATILRNNVFNNANGLQITTGTPSTGIVVNNNRLPGPTAGAGVANTSFSILNNGVGNIDARNNWFATAANGVPGAAVGGSGTTNVSTFLGLRVTTASNAIFTGGGPQGTSLITADFVSCAAACPNPPPAPVAQTFYNGTLNTLPLINFANTALPAGSTVVSATVNPPAPSLVAITRTEQLVSGNVASPPDVNFSATVDGVTIATLPFTAPAGVSNQDVRISNRVADVFINKSVTVIPFSPAVDAIIAAIGANNAASGQQIQYTLRVGNNGPNDAGLVTVNDTFNLNLTNVSWTCTPVGVGTTCGTASGTGNIAGVQVNLPNGGQAIFVILATIAPNTPEATVINNDGTTTNIALGAGVTAFAPPTPNTFPPNITARKVADLGITKTVVTPPGGGTIPAGSNAVYRLTVTNNGPSAYTEALATTSLPLVDEFFNNPATGVTANVNFVCSVPANCTTPPGAAVPVPVGISNPLGRIEVRLGVAQSVDIIITVATTATSGPGSLQDLALVTSPFPAPAFVPAAPVAADFAFTTTPQPYTGYPAAPGNRDPNVPNPCTAPGGDASCNGAVKGQIVTVQSSANLSVTKTRVAPPAGGLIAPGVINYQIIVSNAGPANVPVGALDFSDIFTGSTPLGAVTITCTPAGGATACGNLATLVALPINNNVTANIDNGGTLTINISGSLAPGFAGTTITNTAIITFAAASGFTDPDPTNNVATRVDNVGTSTDIQITKTGAPNPVAAGTEIVFNFVIANNGPANATNVIVTDNLPASHTPGVAAPTCIGGLIPTYTGNVFNLTIPALASGATVTCNVPVKVGANVVGTVVNTAVASLPGGSIDIAPGNNSSTFTYVVTSAAVVDISKDVVSNGLGNPVAYTIIISNTGTGNATGINLVDTIPPEIISPAWTCAVTGGAPTTCVTPSGIGNINITGIALAPGGKVTFTINGTLSPAASGTVVNTATLSGGATDSDDAQIVLGTVADLAIDKTGPATGAASGPINYTISVQNGGPNPVATGATVSDVIDPRITGVTWTCSVTAPGVGAATACTAAGSGSINDPVVLGVGGKLTYLVSGTVAASATGLLVNTASITATGLFADPFPANNTSVVNTTLGPPLPDLAISKIANSSVFTVGQNASYTIVISNTGSATTTSLPISLTDTLPTGITFVSATGTGWLCSPTGSTVNCLFSGPALAVSAKATVTLTVAVGSAAFGTTAVNTATVSTNEPEITGANNVANSAPVTVNRVLQLNVISGTPQSAVISTAFGLPLVAKLTDSLGTPVSGATITFTAPGSGASAVLGGGTTATTDASGLVTKTVTANAITGTYSVTATTIGVATPITYNLTNTATPPLPPPGSQIKLLPATVRIAASVGTFAPLKALNGPTPANPPNASAISIQVTGANGIPTNATGLVGTLTNVNCSAGGNLRFWAGATVPNATNLNIPGARPDLNLTTNFVTGLDAAGKVNLGLGSGDTTAQCDYLVDAIGYLTPTGTGNVTLLPSTFRIASTFPTNNNPSLTSTGLNPSNAPNSSTFTIQARGTGGIPNNAVGIFGVLTNVGCTGGANLRFWAGNTVPFASNLNIPGALSKLNLSTGFIAPLDGTGKVNLGLGAGVTTTCGYAVDVSGYILAPNLSGDLQLLSSSYRIAFTNAPNNNPTITSSGKDPSNPPNSSTFDILATGVSGVPIGSPGIFGVVTNVSCSGGGNFRFWAGSVTSSGVNLNIPGVVPGLNLSSGFTSPINPVTGRVNLGVGSGTPVTCGYVVDVTAFFKP